MLKSVIRAVFGTRHQRELRRLQPMVDEINRHYAAMQAWSDDQVKAQTETFRARIREAAAEEEAALQALREERRHSESAAEREALSQRIGEAERRLKGVVEAVLDEILPEAFATVKEAARRLSGSEVAVTGQTLVWDMIHYDVQLIGGIVLHQGKVAEMATGEGKTLVATLPLYLNALTGRGAHLVTVNSYLAQRDSEWMGHLYRWLGLTVGCIDLHEPNTPERRAAYGADITYGTNNEFGFDYLRDNMVHGLEQRVQRGHAYAIVDEVDSVLIDEARTPLIISGPVGTETNAAYARYNPSVADLYRRQTRIVNDLLAQAERDLAAGDAYAAGEKLFLARRGAPKTKKLLKMLADDPGLQRSMSKVERDYMLEKRVHELEEQLLFSMDEKGHNVHLTDQGLDVLAPDDHEAFVVPDISEAVHRVEHDPSLSVDEKRERIALLEREYAEKSEKIHVIHQLLKGYTLFNRDEQYVVQDGQIMIVDEFTGRMMPGRRWSDGLHQAVEAKEGVAVRAETQTLATITIQNYFRMYDKLAGMTGTAETEEGEFHQIYGLEVMVIPTNRPIQRDDRHDLVYRTKREKYNAIIEHIRRLYAMELPVLVGTVSVDVSETLSRMLKRAGIPHEVLNAKQHQREAYIVAQAGQPGAVTIATNMAGRGTDIKLGPGVTEARTVGWLKAHGVDLAKLPAGPDPQAPDGDLSAKPDAHLVEVGGLHIIGSERHESRRIDRQLRGRAGRQGDPGATEFFLSLEDDLMRLFGSERIAGIMDKLGAEEGEVITHPWITNSIGSAQKRVEMQHFEARKRLLDYDDVMNQQREVIYDLRTFALEGGEELKGELGEMIERAVPRLVAEYTAEGDAPHEWDLVGLRQRLMIDFILTADRLPRNEGDEPEFRTRGEVEEYVLELLREGYHRKLEQFGEAGDAVLRFIVLSTIDEKWKDHLYDLDHLKASIGFRGWGQKDPLVEYKKEAYDMFEDLMADIYASVARFAFRAQLAPSAPPPPPPPVFGTPVPREEPAARFGSEAGSPAPEAPQPPAATPSPAPRRPSLGVNPYAAVPQRPQQWRTNREEEGARQSAPTPAAAAVGRNDPCPCGSGKKYKNCHGKHA
jgi:preprotein translocase subunit SecA